MQKKSIDRIVDEIGLSESLAGALLLKFGWNATRAVDAYLSENNPVFKFFKFNFDDSQKFQQRDTCPSCYEETDQWAQIQDCAH